jgi:AAA domain
MPNQLTDNSNELIWPKGTSAGGAGKLMNFTELIATSAADDPDVKVEDLAEQFEDLAAPTDRQKAFGPSWVTQNVATISRLSREPVKWIIDQFIPYGSITMFAGAGGSMKSWLMMQAAQRITSRAAGHDGELEHVSVTSLEKPAVPTFLGRKVMYGVPVLYVDRENQEGEVGRRASMVGILGNSRFHYLCENANQLAPELDDERLVEFAEKDKGLIIFDSLQDWYGQADENNNSQMAAIIGKMRRLARLGAGVVFIHHLNATGERARGGTTITNLTDMAFNVSKSRSTGIITIKEERFRMCGSWEMTVKPNWIRYPGKLAWEVIGDKGEALIQKEQTEENAEEIQKVRDVIRVCPNLAPSSWAGSKRAKELLGGSMNTAKIIRLAKSDGWTFDPNAEEGLKWTQARNNEEPTDGEVY